MSDIQVTKIHSKREDIIEVEGLSDRGTAFIDGYAKGEFQVVDSGRIIIRHDDLPGFMKIATKAGLKVEAQ
jgi:hypothetical protein